MNCFGFGGVNVHAIIEKNTKEVSDDDYRFGTLPRLVTFCGRNQKTLDNIHQFLVDNPDKMTTGFLALLDQIAKTSPYPNRMFSGMTYRCTRLFKPDDDSGRLKPFDEVRFNQINSETKPSVCFVFTGMGCQWPMMGRELSRIDSMSNVLHKCSETLKLIDNSFDLMNILTSDDSKILQSPINSFVAIAAIQMAIVEFLRQLEIEPDFVIGHSIGELTCAYADQCLSIEETITAAYVRGLCMSEMAEKKPGKMAAIGCTWEQAQQYCQQYSDGKVWPACHNSFDSVTIAGSQSDMDKFITKLQRQEPDLFLRAINSANIAFHCPHINEMRETLRKALNEKICSRQQIRISSKWLTTTYEEDKQEFSLEYLVDNLLEPVRFYQVFQRLPSNIIFVEIAPSNLLQAVIKRNIFERNDDSKYVATMIRKSGENNIDNLLANIGQLYVNGLNPRIEKLYPSYEYPVARTTQSLHSMISWKHDRHFRCTKYPEFFNHDQRKKTYKSVDMQNIEDKFYADHCVDGRILFPATGYLYFAWELASRTLNTKREETSIIFEDVIIHRATIMPKSGVMSFAMKYNKENGMFTMLNNGTVTTTGRIRIPDKGSKFLLYQDMLNTIDTVKTKKCRMQLITKDVYKEFRLRGYDYGPEFQTINEVLVNDEFSVATVKFKNWVTFVDGMIQTVIVGRPIRALLVPVRIDYLACDPIMMSEHLKTISDNSSSGETKSSSSSFLDTIYDFCLNIATSSGIEFRGIKANLAPRRLHPIAPSVSSYEFVPHNEHDILVATSKANSHERRLFLTEQLLQYQDI
ncbi:fatty acid synthase-like protein, partial [Euroglyphus maynei]